MRHARAALLALLTLAAAACPLRAQENAGELIRQATGARTRIVWCRSPSGTGDKFGARDGAGGPYSVVAFDTDTGEHVITPTTNNWNHPIITTDGQRVIFADTMKNIYIANWDSSNMHKLLEGTYNMAVGVAEDPPGTEWVYVARDPAQPEGYKSVWRHQVDHPEIKELVWDRTASIEKWEITRDGKYGASRFPGQPSSTSLPNGKLIPFAPYGCTPGLSADLSTVINEITVTHGGIYLYNRDGSNKRTILFGKGPRELGLNGNECWYASFVRYESRFITFCGPYERRGGAPGNVYFCVLNDAKSAFTTWIKVNRDHDVNTQAYALVLSGAGGSASSSAPGILEGLDIKSLTSIAAQLRHAAKYKPVLDRLTLIIKHPENDDQAKEARLISDHVAEWGTAQLARAKDLETTAPPDAQELYRKLAVKYDGLEVGSAASARLKDNEFLDSVKAWDYYDRMLRAEKSLRDAGEKRSASDEKFAAVNKFYLDQIKKLAATLQHSYANTPAADAARKLLAKYDLTT